MQNMFPPRSLPDLKLKDLHNEIALPGELTTVMSENLRVDLGTEPKVIDNSSTNPKEFPAAGAIESFGDFLKIPAAFLKKVDPQLAEHVINYQLGKVSGIVNIRHSDKAIHEMFVPNRRIVDPLDIIEVAERVIGEEAQVINWYRTSQDFHLDIIQPELRRYADPKNLNDLTCGGLRFDYTSKVGQVPSVQEYYMRLACTNGFERFDESNTLAMRGEMEDFLVELEALARNRFNQLEDTIKNFYSLREHPVDVERALLQYGQEHKLADRVVMNMLEQVPAYFDDDTEEDMFEVANFITNFALNPDVAPAVQLDLERVGGAVADDHSSRCHSCHQKV